MARIAVGTPSPPETRSSLARDASASPVQSPPPCSWAPTDLLPRSCKHHNHHPPEPQSGGTTASTSPASSKTLLDQVSSSTPPLLQRLHSAASSCSSFSATNEESTFTPPTEEEEDPLHDPNTMADAALAGITKGCLRQITQDQNSVEQPVVQCVQIKLMAAGQNGMQRYRVVMNDTVNFIQGMLGQQLNYVITDDKLRKGSICRLKAFTSNIVKDKYILVITDMEVLEEYGEQEKLGQPVGIDSNTDDARPQPDNIAGNGFYGNKPAQQTNTQQQQQRSLPSRTGGGLNANIYPIAAISPYTHKWSIKARCTHKGDIKTWHNKNGEGKLFSVNFLDESGEIRATGFNDAVDQWYEVLQEGSVYYISSPCRVQLAKKQFSNVNNDYELTFERDTIIEKADDTDGVPQVNFNFTTLADLQTVEKDSTIDCIAILQDVGEVSEIVAKTSGKPYSKRELTLVDNTGFNVRLTIWGKTAESFEGQPESVLAFKGLKVSDFGGRSLSLLSSGTMAVDPDIDEAYKLKGWYDGSGRNEQFQSHANTMSTVGATGGGRDQTKTVQQVTDERIGQGEEAEYFNVKATIIYIRQENFAYPACRGEGCQRKVVEIEVGQWRCDKCDQTWDRPEYRYILSANVSDHTGSMWLTCFNDSATQVMGMSADDLMQARDEGDDARVRDAFTAANCKMFVFRCRGKTEMFNDERKVRYNVQYANPLDFAREAKKLADLIKQYDIGSDSLFVA